LIERMWIGLSLELQKTKRPRILSGYKYRSLSLHCNVALFNIGV